MTPAAGGTADPRPPPGRKQSSSQGPKPEFSLTAVQFFLVAEFFLTCDRARRPSAGLGLAAQICLTAPGPEALGRERKDFLRNEGRAAALR